MNESDNNAETVRRGYQAFNAGDMTALTELFDENATWHSPGSGAMAGDFIGREAIFAQFDRYSAETGGTFRAELLNVFKSDNGQVVGLHRNTAERNGKRLDTSCCIVFEFRNGRVVDGREHAYDLYAWDEFWQ